MQKRTYVIIAVATLFLALAYVSSSETRTPIPTAHAAPRTIMLSGSFATGWNGTNPGPTISVTQGESLVLNLVSSDGAPHTFVIDVARAGVVANPNCNIDKCSSQFSSSTTLPFTADLAAGTYTYYCSIHLQHMIGSVVVHSGTNGTPDFGATSNPTTLTVAQGASGSATLTLTSANGFTGSVMLSVAVSPSGPGVSLSSTNVQLASNGSASSVLTVSAASTGLYSTPVSDGTYLVTVTETSGSVSHTTSIQMNIGSSTPGPSSPGSTASMPGYTSGLSGTALLIGVAAVIIVAAVAVITFARRRSNTRP